MPTDRLQRDSNTGSIAAILVAPEAASPMVSIHEVRALAGRGLEGDRYFLGTGAFSRWPGPRRQLTLIASEAIAAAAAEADGALSAADLRRNLVTEGIDLATLMGNDFRIADLRLRGLKLALPCGYLERLSGREDLRSLLREGRGGIRAEILNDGLIRVGDPICLESAESSASSLDRVDAYGGSR